MAEELNEEQESFKIADRRKFNVDGSLREGVVIEKNVAGAELPTTAATTAASSVPSSNNAQTTTSNLSNAAPDVSGADAADVFEPSENETLSSNFQAEFSGDFAEDEAAPDDETSLNEMNIPGAENPASFANFLLSLASQAAAAMGLTENPAAGGRRADLETSRYWLEVLAMLHEKTKGNLHSQEQKLFDGLLSDLRMQYVQLARAAEAQMKKQEEQLLKNAAQKFSGKDILGR